MKNNEIFENLLNEEDEHNLYDPFKIDEICNIDKQLCIFKQHKLLY